MRFMMLAMTFALALGESAGAQTLSEDSVHVGVFGYQADGSVVVSAFGALPSTNALVYSTGSACLVGTGHREPPNHATDAWRFSGRVLSATSEAAVIELDWRRVLDQGSAGTASGSSVRLTLPAGEKVVLDHVAAPIPSRCSTRTLLFEARYGLKPMEIVVRPESRAQPGDEGSATERLRAYRVNLWFVRSAPGRADQVLGQPVLVMTKSASFTFPAITIDAPAGPIAVRVTGSFEIRKGSNGEELLVVTGRRVTPSSGTTRDRPADIQGISKLTIPMPGPQEVLSFEMPPIRLHGGAELPDRFSVRVQIRPR